VPPEKTVPEGEAVSKGRVVIGMQISKGLLRELPTYVCLFEYRSHLGVKVFVTAGEQSLLDMV